jgi:hypothetical protein
VELEVGVAGRVGAAAETAAYLAVLDAVDAAARAGATFAHVRITQSHRELTVDVEDDAPLPPSTRSSLADRIGTLDGSLHWQANSVRAVIPCG